jgi:hypothetical protein
VNAIDLLQHPLDPDPVHLQAILIIIFFTIAIPQTMTPQHAVDPDR